MADPANAFDDIGPCGVYFGDATEAAGAGMANLGFHEDVSGSLNIRTGYANSANTNDVAIQSSLITLPANPQISVQLYDKQQQNLLDMMREHAELLEEEGSDPAVVFRARTRRLTTGVLAIIPQQEIADGADAKHGIWLLGAYLMNVNNLFTFGRTQEGANNTPFTAEFGASVNQVGDITLGFGPPARWGAAYSLPGTASQPAA